MKPVDSHCHLDFEQFDSDRENVIERCQRKMKKVVIAGVNPGHNRKVQELMEDNLILEGCLGLHPVYTDDFSETDRVRKQITENDPSAVGEIGLDHHHVQDSDTRKRQEEVFRSMLEIAEDLGKPVVVHSRNAEKRAVEMLEKYSVAGMLHCFNGSVELMEDAVDKGLMIGVTTQVLYSSHVQDIASEVPIENLMLETDSPYLYQGERNEPVNVYESAEKIADLRALEEEKVIKKTTGNAESFFSF